jgi:hypothetical protein
LVGGNSEFVHFVVNGILHDEIKTMIMEEEFCYNVGNQCNDMNFGKWIQNLCIQVTMYILSIFENEVQIIEGYTHIDDTVSDNDDEDEDEDHDNDD